MSLSPEVIGLQIEIQKELKAYFKKQSASVLSQINKKLSKLEKSNRNIQDIIDSADDEDITEEELDDLLDDIDYNLSQEEDKSFIDKVSDNLFKIGLISATYAMIYLNSKGKILSNAEDKPLTSDNESLITPEAEDYIKEYTKNRSAELIGKSVLEDGSVIDNPDANMSITESTRDSIKVGIKDAINNGDSNKDLADSIQENYAFSEERSIMIARTETSIADNDITMVTYKNGGIEKKAWLTANDDLVSEECEANEAEGAIDIDDNFSSGDECPPCHPNCRCTLIAVFNE